MAVVVLPVHAGGTARKGESESVSAVGAAVVRLGLLPPWHVVNVSQKKPWPAALGAGPLQAKWCLVDRRVT